MAEPNATEIPTTVKSVAPKPQFATIKDAVNAQVQTSQGEQKS